MKKFLRVITTILAAFLLSITFTACASNNNDNSENTSEQSNYTHSVNINNETLFNYYFTTTVNTSSTSDTTITISPKLTGFVDYSGYVDVKLYSDSSQVFRWNLDYWGNSSKTVPSSNLEFKFISADIVITYHHEGLSGMSNLNYETVLITKYNYKSYLNVTVSNRYTYTHTRQDGYIYHYYQTYTVTPVYNSSSCREFNNVVLKFSNGVSITLDALGKTTYTTAKYSTEQAIPILSEITGCIDFYPTAIYK